MNVARPYFAGLEVGHTFRQEPPGVTRTARNGPFPSIRGSCGDLGESCCDESRGAGASNAIDCKCGSSELAVTQVWVIRTDDDRLQQEPEEFWKVFRAQSERGQSFNEGMDLQAMRATSFLARHYQSRTYTRGAFEQQELGIEQALWIHSSAGKKPRPSHVAMNNKPYPVAAGIRLEDDLEIVWPGTAINCRCVSRAILPELGVRP